MDDPSRCSGVYIMLWILESYRRILWMLNTSKEPTFPEHLWGTFAKEMRPERYFVSKTDQNYDERHSLSSALRNWQQRLSEAQENEWENNSHKRKLQSFVTWAKTEQQQLERKTENEWYSNVRTTFIPTKPAGFVPNFEA
jgi:hypothetical protein